MKIKQLAAVLLVAVAALLLVCERNTRTMKTQRELIRYQDSLLRDYHKLTIDVANIVGKK
ncbi:MAG: hypothetical protein ACLVKO_09060 [Dysgonomonas sp.]